MDNICVFCCSTEGYICSWCLQKILAMNQEQLKQAYDLAVERGLTDRAEALSKMMEGEEYVPETGKARSDLVRKRPVRAARLAYHEIRTQSAA